MDTNITSQNRVLNRITEQRIIATFDLIKEKLINYIEEALPFKHTSIVVKISGSKNVIVSIEISEILHLRYSIERPYYGQPCELYVRELTAMNCFKNKQVIKDIKSLLYKIKDILYESRGEDIKNRKSYTVRLK